MTITVSTDVVCDSCGDWVVGVRGTTFAQATLARDQAEACGWTRPWRSGFKRYVDLCPRCSK